MEKTKGVINAHIEHLGDIHTLIFNFKRFRVETSPRTNFARRVYIRKKMHFNFFLPFALAGLAAPAFHIETETGGGVSAFFGLISIRENIPNVGKNSGICR